MASRTDSRSIGRAALEAVASPARLELLSALGAGATTTRALARRLGRSRPSLYYHLGLLERAGLVAVEPPVEGGRERRFRLRTERLAIGARRGSARDRAAAAKAIRAILRLTAREASAALTDPDTRFDGAVREMIGFRGKARLTQRQLRRTNTLIDELEALFRTARVGAGDVPLYALTVVLTPAHESGDSEDGY